MNKKESPKLDKRERRRNANRRQSLAWNVGVLGSLGVFVILVGLFIWNNQRPGPMEGEQIVADEGQGHVAVGTELSFLHEPPVSGSHYDQLADWGFAPAPVPPGGYLHNLHVGGVVFLYHCAEACPDLERQLRDFYKDVPPDNVTNTAKVLITAYEKDLPAPLVALGWNAQLNLAQFDKDKLLLWYRRYVNQGPK